MMKTNLHFLLLFYFSLPAFSQLSHHIDWKALPARKDLVLDFLPGKWGGGSFLVNDLPGGMVCCQDAYFLRIDLERADVASLRVPIEKSLELWEDNKEAWRGCFYTGAGSVYVLMDNGTLTHHRLKDMTDMGRFAIKPNTLYMEAGSVIEWTVPPVTIINEMLLQSWGSVVRVFPVIPGRWIKAVCQASKVKDSFGKSLVCKGEVPRFLPIKRLAGTRPSVKTAKNTTVKSGSQRTYKIFRPADGLMLVNIKREKVFLYTGEKLFVISEATVIKRSYYWSSQKELSKIV